MRILNGLNCMLSGSKLLLFSRLLNSSVLLKTSESFLRLAGPSRSLLPVDSRGVKLLCHPELRPFKDFERGGGVCGGVIMSKGTLLSIYMENSVSMTQLLKQSNPTILAAKTLAEKLIRRVI